MTDSAKAALLNGGEFYGWRYEAGAAHEEGSAISGWRQKERGDRSGKTRRPATSEQAASAGNKRARNCSAGCSRSIYFWRNSDVTAKASRCAPHRRTWGQPRKPKAAEKVQSARRTGRRHPIRKRAHTGTGQANRGFQCRPARQPGKRSTEYDPPGQSTLSLRTGYYTDGASLVRDRSEMEPIGARDESLPRGPYRPISRGESSSAQIV
jgi:hypothetical protein